MRSDKYGFSVPEVMIAVVVIGILSLTGWYIFSRSNTGTKSDTDTQELTSESPDQNKPLANKLSIRADLPTGWVEKDYDEPKGGFIDFGKIFKAPSGLEIVAYWTNAGGRGSGCTEDYERQQPHSSQNTCATYEILKKEIISSNITLKDGSVSSVYVVWAKYSPRPEGSAEPEFIITLMNDKVIESKFDKVSGKTVSFDHYQHDEELEKIYDSPNKYPIHISVMPTGNDESYFEQADVLQAIQLLKSITFIK